VSQQQRHLKQCHIGIKNVITEQHLMTVVTNMHKTSYVMSWLWRCLVSLKPLQVKCYPKLYDNKKWFLSTKSAYHAESMKSYSPKNARLLHSIHKNIVTFTQNNW